VEFAAEGDLPSGSTIDYYVRNDADSAWVEYQDGDTPDDLAGVTGQQYYKIQATLTPDASGQVSPVLRMMGAREITIEDLSDVAEVVGIQQGVDPITGKGAITEAIIQAIQDGERDYNDAITTLLSSYDIGAIQFRAWVGHPNAATLARSNWMKLDDFLIDGYDVLSGAVRLRCLSPLVLVRGKVPIYNTGTNTREPLIYNASGLKTTYDDLLDAQIALPGRFRGPGVEDDTTTVSKIIEDSDAKAELDAIAFLNGGGIISSQGRVKYVDLFGDKSIVASFPSEELEPLGASPGFEDRIPEYYVPWDWSFDERIYKEEHRYSQAAALTKLGIARVEAPTILDPTVAEWITVATLADTVGNRMVDAFGTGLVTLSFRSTYAYPELEPGDLVAVQTDKFIARDPTTSRAIKGSLWVVGVVIGINGIWGQEFKVWVRGYEDIFASSATGDVSGFLKRFRAKVYKSGNQAYSAGSAAVVSFNSEANDHGDLHDTVTNNERVTIPTGGDGTYDVEAQLPFLGGTYGWYLTLRKNGSQVIWQDHEVGLAVGTMHIKEMLDLVAGDYLDLYVDCAHSLGSGTVTLVGGGEDDCSFSVVRKGV
jgi:hypothetical protein